MGWFGSAMEAVGKAIPNEISKLNSITRFIPVVGPISQGVSALDNFATSYGDGDGLMPALKSGMSGVMGQSRTSNDIWGTLGSLGNLIPSSSFGNAGSGSSAGTSASAPGGSEAYNYLNGGGVDFGSIVSSLFGGGQEENPFPQFYQPYMNQVDPFTDILNPNRQSSSGGANDINTLIQLADMLQRKKRAETPMEFYADSNSMNGPSLQFDYQKM
jgi:hypothetical protein